jgi:integrase
MASIRKRALKGGKVAWQVDYRDQAGARRHKQFQTKREADAWLVQARAQVAAGIHTPDSASITVSEAADLWLARCTRDGLEATTIRQYKAHVEIHIVPRIGKTKLARLSAPAANAFIDQLIHDGRSKEMARRVLRSLSAIVGEAQRRGLVAANNVRDAAPVKSSKRERARPAMPTKDELRRIIEGAPDRWRPLILVAIFTGLRASELRGLRWCDIDLKKGALHVRRRVDRFNKFGAPKSESSTRDIPLSPVVLSTLKSWRLACPTGALDLVFPNRAGNVESHGNLLRRVLWPIQIVAGVAVQESDGPRAKFSLHALRHAAAALWIEQGLSPKRIQALMGHASIQQTFDTYGYLFDTQGDDETAMAAIEARLLR